MKVSIRLVETEMGREFRAWVPVTRSFEGRCLYLGDVLKGGDTVRIVGGQACRCRGERPGFAISYEDISRVTASPGVPCELEMPRRPRVLGGLDPDIAALWEQMKPCPFCGSAEPGDLFTEVVGGAVCCLCNNCLSGGPEAMNEADAVQRWNKRPPSKEYDPYRCTCGHREADRLGGGPDSAYGEAGPCTKCKCASYQEESA